MNFIQYFNTMKKNNFEKSPDTSSSNLEKGYLCTGLYPFVILVLLEESFAWRFIKTAIDIVK